MTSFLLKKDASITSLQSTDQYNYDLFVPSKLSDLPKGILAPIVSDEDLFIRRVIASANLSADMNFYGITNQVLRCAMYATVSEITDNAIIHYNAGLDQGLSTEVVSRLYSYYTNQFTHENLIKAIISDYPIALWGSVSGLSPEDITGITVENMPWTMKAIVENRNHMRRVSQLCGILGKHLFRTYGYDSDSRELLEEIFFENGWDFNPDTIRYFGPFITLGLIYAGRIHDIGKTRMLQVIYQPKTLTIEEREIVDKHIDLSLKVFELFRRCTTTALLLHTPQYLALWDLICEIALKAVKYHHPDKSGSHTASGDVVASCDVFDVLTRPRIYKLEYYEPDRALTIMSSIQHLNPRVLRLLPRALSSKYLVRSAINLF